MFEQKFKALILGFLGEFVEEFDDSSLRVDNWSGQVTQTRLRLLPGSLRFLSMMLGIDIRVVRGIIGTLQLSFNWRALWKEPIKLTLEDLYIVCKPSDTPDASIFTASQRSKKRAKVEDKQLKTKLINPNKTYFQQLESTIVDNLCVSVKNVHIRYEDTTSNPFKPFVIGFTLDKLNYSPADSSWKKSFVTLEAKKQAQKSFMLLELAQFSIYHISKSSDLFTSKVDWLQAISNDKFASVMYQFIAHRDSVSPISDFYLLRPVNAEIRVRRSLKPPLEADIPKLSVSILVEEMACALDNNQYQDLLMLGSVLSLHKAVGIYINLRPSQRPRYKTRDWWIYVLTRIKDKVIRKLRSRTKEFLEERRTRKAKYVSLYKHFLVKEYESEYNRTIANFLKLPNYSSLRIEDLNKELLQIEDLLNVEEIYLFRCIAERELSAVKEKKKGWFEWGRGWFTSNSAEEENFLKSLVEYSELISSDQQVTTKYTKSFIYFFLNKCSISLDSRHINNSRVSLLKLSLYQATVHRTITPSLTKTFAALSSLKIIDPFTPIEKFRKLFTPKGIDESYFEGNPSFEIEEEIFPEENDGFPEFSCTDFKQEPLFKLEFNSVEAEEMSLRASLKPLEIVYNKYCIERITSFFKVPEALALYESIEIQTMSQLSKLKTRTQARLDLLMKNRLNIDIDVTVSAPLIIVPENTLNEDTSLILLNTGDLRITSKPRLYNISLLTSRKNSDIDDNTYYDDFEIQITDINVALMPAESSIAENIVEKFNIRMQVSKSVIPKDPFLTTLKVSGEIQELTAKLSKLQYMTLRQYSNSQQNHPPPEPLVEYKPPVIIEDPDDEEFFDLPDNFDSSISENIKFPFEKEHFRANFSIKSVSVAVVDESFKEVLTFNAKDLMLGHSNQEAKNIFALRLGYIQVHDWVENRDVVNSNSEASDLVNIELTRYLECHPEYNIQEFHSHFWMAITDLHINYYEGKS
jgi:vacuolar protein sorting-associated protein 13A/C